MNIAIASDHGGYQLKELLKEYIKAKGEYEILDLGVDSEESVDYPSYGIAVGEVVAQGKAEKGIVCCGTGLGISIACNKVKGIRCALCTDVHMAALSRQHNNANVLALGGRTTFPEDAKAIVDTWLSTDFEGDRHQRRLDIISDYESK